MQWLRLYHDTAHDPKWRVVAVEAEQPLATVLGVWTYMLIFASQAKTRGTLEGWNDRVAGAALDLKGDAIALIRKSMQGVVLDGDKLTGWDRRQRNSDNVAERVRKHRQVHKPVTPDNDPNGVTDVTVTERNENVTLHSPDVTVQSGFVTENPLRAQTQITEEEKKDPPNPPLGGSGDLFFEGSGVPAKSETTRRTRSPKQPKPPKVYSPSIEESFSRFKAAYPMRSNPHTWSGDNGAKARFAMHVECGVDCEIMISAASRYAAAMTVQGKVRTDGVADALTWINQRRWEMWIDEPENPQPNPSNVTNFPSRDGHDQQPRKPKLAGVVG